MRVSLPVSGLTLYSVPPPASGVVLGTILGTLDGVSADQLEDPRGGTPYFVARIHIDESELDRLDGLELVPGMPAEVFIQTGERLAISYLLKPLLETLARAFKDG